MLRHWRLLVAYTAIEVAIPWALLAQAETKLTSSLTGLLIAAVPLVGALAVMYTGGRERHDRASGSGLLIGLLGVAALVGLDFGQLDVLALIEVAFVAICYAIRPIMLARSLGGVSALGVVAASLLITTLVYAPLAATHLPDGMPSSHVVESVLGLALVCTVIAFLLFFTLISEVGPEGATVITYVNPAVAALLGVALLGEHLTTGMIVGFALVLVGSVLATGRRAEPVPEP